MSSSRPLDDAQKQGGFLQAVQSQVKIEFKIYCFSQVMTEKLSLSHQTVGKITMVTTETGLVNMVVNPVQQGMKCFFSFRLLLKASFAFLLDLSSNHGRWVFDLLYC